MKEKFNIVAKTLSGLEEILARELSELGAEDINILKRAVSYRGDTELLYKSNLYLRTAIKVLKPIASFPVLGGDGLYFETKKIKWSNYLDLDDTFSIDSVVFSRFFKHSNFVSLKVKDAIADQFREKTNKRPSVDTENPILKINVHIADKKCTISLDSSGESLHKRGYRKRNAGAPLNESLAAGMILMSDWNNNRDFIDPMCGSGTLLIEAATIAMNIPPNINRENFSFTNWKNFDKNLWDSIIKNALENVKAKGSLEHRILGYDVSRENINITKENIRNAKLSSEIELNVKSISTLEPQNSSGTIIMNPPFGKRLRKEDINKFYANIGKRIKFHFPNFEVWILSNNFGALKHIGLKPDVKKTLYNGALECKYLKYSIYDGSKKDND